MSSCASKLGLASYLALSAFTLGYWTTAAYAEGSRELTNSGGNRPFLEYRRGGTGENFFTGEVPRRTTIKVYANAGETIYLGSSATGLGVGTINYRAPDGTTASCGAGVGVIANRTQELAGPNPLSPGGYTPCIITKAMTTTAGSGIWDIDFVSPNLTNISNPIPVTADANWSLSGSAATPNIQSANPTAVVPPGAYNYNVSYVAAWDVTVTNGLVPIPGRVFADYLALNMGANGLQLSSQVYIQTRDGYQYTIDFNGLDPFGFILFSNNRGFLRTSDNLAIYRSVLLSDVPSTYTVHPPSSLDTTFDTTNKIFFLPPNSGAVEAIPTDTGFFKTTPVIPQPAQNLIFTGKEGTPNQAGSFPLGGQFSFYNPNTFSGSYTLSIDTNQNGIYNDPEDRILLSTASPLAINTVQWEGIDGLGNPVPLKTLQYNARITINGGETHFPLLDAETSAGLVVTRINPASGPNASTIYYDDTNGNFQLLGGPNINPSNPPSLLQGADSSVGNIHQFGASRGSGQDFGDEKGISTWTYFPSTAVEALGLIEIKQADLQITKTDNQTTITAGSPITYTIEVYNDGPSDITGATVLDNIPTEITDVSWSCAIVTEPATGACGAATGTGNTISTTVNLNNQARARYTVTGTVSRTASGTLTNTAKVLRPNDVTDPTDIDRTGAGNNTATDTTTIVGVPVANKSVRFFRDHDGTGTLTVGDDVQYTIIVRNLSPTTAVNDVVIRDVIPTQLLVLVDGANPVQVNSGFSLASSFPSSSFNATGERVTFTNPGTLAPGGSVTLIYNARIRPGSAGPIANQGLINYGGDGGNPIITDASDTTNPTAPGSGVNSGIPSNLTSGGTINQPNDNNTDLTIVDFVSPVTPTGSKSVRLFTDADNSGSVTTGDVVEYTIIYVNTGSSSASDFLATDSIDANQLRFVSGSYRFTAAGAGTTVNQNLSYNGTTDINLTNPNNRGVLGAGGGRVTIKFQATITAETGTQIRNQASVTATGGTVNLSLTDGVAGPGELPQELDDGINQGNLSNTGDDDPTLLTVGGVVGEPRLRLVKRITSIRRGGVPLSGIDFGSFVDDSADPDDNAPGWSPVGVTQLGSESAVGSGDEVEYTIYFLSDGATIVKNVKFCDPIPTGTMFVRDSFGNGTGISLNRGGTTTSQTNAVDADPGAFFSALAPLPLGNACPNSTNTDGAVLVNLEEISHTAGSNLGFIRFRVTIN